jgi:predicted signal transduction protein with EAL and GGDEF domain
MRFAPHVTYPLIGLLLGAGAPVGSFLMRVLAIPSVRDRPFDDLRVHAFFYLYELVASSLVFAIAGYAAGRRADRLRRGVAFYHHLAEHDSLTGLHNARRSWTATGARWSTPRRMGSRWRSSSSTSTS